MSTPDRPSDAVLRRVRLLAALSAGAAVLAIALPPVGAGLGVVTLAVSYRHRREVRHAKLGVWATSVPVVGGVFAVLVGAAFSTILVIFADDLREARQCHAGANTHLAEQRCQRELIDQLWHHR